MLSLFFAVDAPVLDHWIDEYLAVREHYGIGAKKLLEFADPRQNLSLRAMKAACRMCHIVELTEYGETVPMLTGQSVDFEDQIHGSCLALA